MYLNFDNEGLGRLLNLEEVKIIGYRFYGEMLSTDQDSFSVEVASVHEDMIKVKYPLILFFDEGENKSSYTISKEGFFNCRNAEDVFELTEKAKYNIITPDENKKWKGKIDLRHINQKERK